MRHLFFALPLLIGSLAATPIDSPYLMQSPLLEKHVLLHNRVLAKIRGKSISLVDVVKRMNIICYERDRRSLSDPHGLLQFYRSHWLEALNELINDELVLLEAAEKDIHISEGEIREEVERRFGPNVVAALAKLQLTYDEAKTYVKNDLIIRQLKHWKVYSKVMQRITPQKIKNEYAKFVAANPPKDKFEYKILTIRPQEELSDDFISKISTACIGVVASLEDIRHKIESDTPNATVSISSSMTSMDNELSEENKTLLLSLEEGALSPLQKQWSRQSNSYVLRSYQLIKHHIITPPPFEKLYDNIKEKLLGFEFSKEQEAYANFLREKYHVSSSSSSYLVPEGYEPFEIME